MEKKGICLPVTRDGSFCYNIVVQEDFGGLADAVGTLDISERRICIVTDSNVARLYADRVSEILRPLCRELEVYVFPAGEEHKDLSEIRKMYTFFAEHGLDRKDLVVALGGGVTGDMAGFAAATYLRGIRFVQIPTTLLSQVDSSIGGKTGVDFDGFKNMVGAFHMPSLVYIAAETLATLPDDQFASGMGEVLKHGLIRNAGYYEWTIEHMSEIEDRNLPVLMKMVEESCRIKRSVVEKDPTEQGIRAILNFGHTLGHAIESCKQFTLLHGECVALGCIAAAHISWKRGYLDSDEFYEIRDMMVGFNLPLSFDSLTSDEILEAVKHDKKMSAGRIRFILLKAIGKAFIDDTVTEKEMKDALDTLNADLWPD